MPWEWVSELMMVDKTCHWRRLQGEACASLGPLGVGMDGMGGLMG
jgi:hypothetical protein